MDSENIKKAKLVKRIVHYQPPAPPAPKVGLGDIVEIIAKPVAVALKLDCIDKETKQLKPESPCGKRKAALNAAVPNINPLA